MKLAAAGALGLLSALLALPARAGNVHACDAAYERAQTLRDAKSLLAAREQLRLCARATCPGFMVKDCTTWLGEVEARIPSVVLVATDGAGAPLQDVTVSVDAAGRRPLDGTSVEIDPGPHRFAFVLSDGTKLVKEHLVVEGQKEQRVAVTFGSPHPAETAAEPAPPADPAVNRFPYAGLGYAIGAVGVAGLVVGGIFGVEALATKGNHCNAQDACTPGTSSTIHTDASVATVGLVGGGVLAAAGLTFILLAPSKREAHALHLEATPLVACGSAGLSIGGSW
jgi:hypothetical protein